MKKELIIEIKKAQAKMPMKKWIPDWKKLLSKQKQWTNRNFCWKVFIQGRCKTTRGKTLFMSKGNEKLVSSARPVCFRHENKARPHERRAYRKISTSLKENDEGIFIKQLKLMVSTTQYFLLL